MQDRMEENMRLRNVPGAREVMVENEYVFTEPEGMKGTWKDVFKNDNPIHIEIGMAKVNKLSNTKYRLADNSGSINLIMFASFFGFIIILGITIGLMLV